MSIVALPSANPLDIFDKLDQSPPQLLMQNVNTSERCNVDRPQHHNTDFNFEELSNKIEDKVDFDQGNNTRNETAVSDLEDVESSRCENYFPTMKMSGVSSNDSLNQQLEGNGSTPPYVLPNGNIDQMKAFFPEVTNAFTNATLRNDRSNEYSCQNALMNHIRYNGMPAVSTNSSIDNMSLYSESDTESKNSMRNCPQLYSAIGSFEHSRENSFVIEPKLMKPYNSGYEIVDHFNPRIVIPSQIKPLLIPAYHLQAFQQTYTKLQNDERRDKPKLKKKTNSRSNLNAYFSESKQNDTVIDDRPYHQSNDLNQEGKYCNNNCQPYQADTNAPSNTREEYKEEILINENNIHKNTNLLDESINSTRNENVAGLATSSINNGIKLINLSPTHEKSEAATDSEKHIVEKKQLVKPKSKDTKDRKISRNLPAGQEQKAIFCPSSQAYTPRINRNSRPLPFVPADQRSSSQTMRASMGSIQRPNFRDALRRVAMILHQHIVKIEKRFSSGVDPSGLFLPEMRDEFKEDKYTLPRYKCSIVRVPMCRSNVIYSRRQMRPDYEQGKESKDMSGRIPSEVEIYEFAHKLFKKVHLSSECSIVCLIYVERLMEVAKVPFMACTWRPIFMIGLLLASKVWQDLSSWNVEFASVYPKFSLDAINRLERQYLKVTKWNLYISSSIYAKYYFALRSLLEKKTFRQKYNQMVGGVGNVAQSEAMKIQQRTEKVKEDAILQLSCSM